MPAGLEPAVGGSQRLFLAVNKLQNLHVVGGIGLHNDRAVLIEYPLNNNLRQLHTFIFRTAWHAASQHNVKCLPSSTLQQDGQRGANLVLLELAQ